MNSLTQWQIAESGELHHAAGSTKAPGVPLVVLFWMLSMVVAYQPNPGGS
jgi:hypothetical protein